LDWCLGHVVAWRRWPDSRSCRAIRVSYDPVRGEMGQLTALDLMNDNRRGAPRGLKCGKSAGDLSLPSLAKLGYVGVRSGGGDSDEENIVGDSARACRTTRIYLTVVVEHVAVLVGFLIRLVLQTD
jgi:hypothetical protein